MAIPTSGSGVDVRAVASGREGTSGGPVSALSPGTSERPDRTTALEQERALLRRMVAALGLRLVAMADNRVLLVSNVSMQLTAEEGPVLARMIRGG